MAELSINADQIAEALRKHVGGFSTTLEKARVGRVLEVGDGIARVSGLPETAVNELLEFEGGTLGLALNLDEDSIGAVVLGEAEEVEEGHTVQETGRILSVPVGDVMLGRVVKRSGSRSTARARSTPRRTAGSRSRRRASSPVVPCTSRCRRGSRPSTR